MIFGKTFESQEDSENLRIAKMANGVRMFAFLPVQLHDGRILWLQRFYRFFLVGCRPGGNLYLYSSSHEDLVTIYKNHLENLLENRYPESVKAMETLKRYMS